MSPLDPIGSAMYSASPLLRLLLLHRLHRLLLLLLHRLPIQLGSAQSSSARLETPGNPTKPNETKSIR